MFPVVFQRSRAPLVLDLFTERIHEGKEIIQVLTPGKFGLHHGGRNGLPFHHGFNYEFGNCLFAVNDIRINDFGQLVTVFYPFIFRIPQVGG